MKVSLNWLRDYIVFDMEVSELAYALTMAGLEVDAVSDRYNYLETVVASRILDICKHPKADRLSLCRVDAGGGRVLEIVCGASNVKEGIIVPLALPGTVLPNGAVIEKNVIRGKTSEGMLCSETELELGTDKKGIMILSDTFDPGVKLADALSLSDTVIEIDLTPNRPDCLSIIGVAREVGVFVNKKINLPKSLSYGFNNFELSQSTFNSASVMVEDHDCCQRYTARMIEDVVVAPSPSWLQDRLVSVGIKPVNNIVDITNYVMIETGQPLHAFDFEKLKGGKLVVRGAEEGEMFTTLDNKKRHLASGMLMICDSENPVAIAGIMGGMDSEIKASTTKVLLESAYFDPVSIRKTSKKLGLNTESSHRFERGVDPEGVIKASNRASELIAEIGCGRIAEEMVDIHSEDIERDPIFLSAQRTNRLLGVDLDQDSIEKMLKSIECTVNKIDADKLSVFAPSFRVDINRPADLIEEVARIYGYDNIDVTFPLVPTKCVKSIDKLNNRNQIKEIMTGFGFYETITYSFINKQSCDMLGLKPGDKRRDHVEIINPLVKDHGVMRSSLIPGLLETMQRNNSHQVKNLKIFETGKIFINTKSGQLPEEIEMIAGLQTGSRDTASWDVSEQALDFYDIKGVVEALFNSLNVSGLKGSPVSFTKMPEDQCTYTKKGRTAEIFWNEKRLGLIGEISNKTLNLFNITEPAFIFELDLDRIYPLIPNCVFSKPLPKFPSVSRDITMIIDKHIEVAMILRKVEELKEKWVEDVSLFDVFEGEPVNSEKKSVSLRIKYRSDNKTLEDQIVNDIHKKLSNRLIGWFKAALPE